MKIRSLLCVLSVLFRLASAWAAGQEESGDYKVLVMGDAHFDAPEFHRTPPASDGRREKRSRFGSWPIMARRDSNAIVSMYTIMAFLIKIAKYIC